MLSIEIYAADSIALQSLVVCHAHSTAVHGKDRKAMTGIARSLFF